MQGIPRIHTKQASLNGNARPSATATSCPLARECLPWRDHGCECQETCSYKDSAGCHGNCATLLVRLAPWRGKIQHARTILSRPANSLCPMPIALRRLPWRGQHAYTYLRRLADMSEPMPSTLLRLTLRYFPLPEPTSAHRLPNGSDVIKDSMRGQAYV